MKRRCFVRNRKMEGKLIFLIGGISISTIMFIQTQGKETELQYCNKPESVEVLQMRDMDNISQENVVGMTIKSSNLQEKEEIDPVELFSEEELFLLQQIVFAEAGEASPSVQKGVTNVILNRMNSDRYPDSVKDVIFQKNQFSPTEKDKNTGEDKIFFWDWPDNKTCYYREVEEADITEEVKESVMAAINGDNPIEDMTGFYSLRWITDAELAKREKAGFYSSDWVLDDNLNPIEPVKEDVIIIDGVVFHGDWT